MIPNCITDVWYVAMMQRACMHHNFAATSQKLRLTAMNKTAMTNRRHAAQHVFSPLSFSSTINVLEKQQQVLLVAYTVSCKTGLISFESSLAFTCF